MIVHPYIALRMHEHRVRESLDKARRKGTSNL